MGTLMKNGIPYGGGGGGDNSKTVTYEQYKNLSEAEKNSDTTYYVPDYPEGENNDFKPELLLDKISEQNIYDIDVNSYNDYYVDISIDNSVSLPFYILSMETGKRYRCSFTDTVYADITFKEDGKVELGIIPGNYEKLYITIYGMKKTISTIATEIVDNLDSTDTDKSLSANMGRELKKEVDTISDNLSKNKFDATTNLLTYNSTSNRYTFPSDGYVCLYCYTDGGKGTLAITGSDKATTIYLGGSGFSYTNSYYNSIFVKAGMTAYCDSFTDGLKAYYVPLT